MIFSNSLAKYNIPAVLDTSVIINLSASQSGGQILDAIPNNIIVPQPVVTELNHQMGKVESEVCFIDALISSGKVQKVELSENELELFKRTVAANNSLGDGEAATIAVASQRNSLAILDDRKGRNHVRSVMANVILGWSIEIFLHPFVLSRIGEDGISEAVYLALRDGHMRIHETHCEEVVKIIGIQRALDCPSLPNFKTRRKNWLQLLMLGRQKLLTDMLNL